MPSPVRIVFASAAAAVAQFSDPVALHQDPRWLPESPQPRRLGSEPSIRVRDFAFLRSLETQQENFSFLLIHEFVLHNGDWPLQPNCRKLATGSGEEVDLNTTALLHYFGPQATLETENCTFPNGTVSPQRVWRYVVGDQAFYDLLDMTSTENREPEIFREYIASTPELRCAFGEDDRTAPLRVLRWKDTFVYMLCQTEGAHTVAPGFTPGQIVAIAAGAAAGLFLIVGLGWFAYGQFQHVRQMPAQAARVALDNILLNS